MTLQKYRAKRDFRKTPEPAARSKAKRGGDPIFVIQEHHASRLHYDLRLEADGVLKSWAVPKEPSMTPGEKRLAVHVEDHPLAYANFEGEIPAGQYGAGTVSIWDRGTFDNLMSNGAARSITKGIESGEVKFALHGKKLHGAFTLVRMKSWNRRQDNWLLIKKHDADASDRDGAVPDEPTKNAPQEPRRPKSEHHLKGQRPSKSKAPPDIEAMQFTHVEKVLFPDDGITKADVLQYYAEVSPFLLPHLRDRPVTLERYPDGISPGAPSFWQKNTPDYVPAWVPRVNLPHEGKPVHYVLINDVQTLLYLVNQGALTFHVWLSRVKQLDRPDYVLFDLDPGEASFADAVTIARKLHDALRHKRANLKTSGKSGLHILVPWHERGGYDAARKWALEVADAVVESAPELATTVRAKAGRQGRVYIDVMQNSRGRHVVPPYVIRPLPGAPVSTPLHWHELNARLTPRRFNVHTVPRRLAKQRHDLLAALAVNE